jgi:hypothetical protein
MQMGEHWRWRYRSLAPGEVRKENPATTPAELAERQEAERLNRNLVLIPIGEPDFDETAPGVSRSAID